MRFLPFLILVAFACNDKKSLPANTDLFLPGRPLAELKADELEEVSGLAASVANRGYLWTHNDSGNAAEVYLINEKLDIALTCRLEGVKNRDWEDIAVGPGPDPSKRYVYVAEIGDNNAQYDYKYIYRFAEPSLTSVSGDITITEFDTIVFRLEDGAKDTEALLVHPTTGQISIVTKREYPVAIYELPVTFNAGDTLMARQLTTIPLSQVVAADWSPDGSELLLKNYLNVYYWDMAGKALNEALQEEPLILPYTKEPQGEAITFKIDGSGYYTLSEKRSGEASFLYFYERN